MVIDGKIIAASLKEDIKKRVEEANNLHNSVPSLVVILVGNDPASQSYVNGKIKATQTVGIKSSLLHYDTSVSEKELLSKIEELNNDTSVDGILVQLPLPSHIDEMKVIAAIAPRKDVDGFNPENVAKLWLGQDCIVPCTPKGIMYLLEKSGIDIEGKHAVIIGRSNIVGKPVAKLLMDANATVTIAHSHSQNLKEICLTADIIISAVGKAHIVNSDMIQSGAVLIDVGIHRDEATGKLQGDIDFEECLPKASYITPVPGGVGPMTIAMLMQNTLECYLTKVQNEKF